MKMSYDIFKGAFLFKVTEFELINFTADERDIVIDGYMKRAVVSFNTCKYDLASHYDDECREFDIDVPENDVDELVEIISEGMLVQWMKPYVYNQENLMNVLNTKDFSTYSPAELVMRVGNAYQKVQSDYKQMVYNYSYNHGDLTDLHL